jgi:hypothetical protein
LELAARLYNRRPGRAGIRPYRRAEVAFMRWQISRGVLASPTASRPGSPWWRAVNEDLIRDSGKRTCWTVVDPGRPAGRASKWLASCAAVGEQLVARTTPASSRTLDHRDLAQLELPVERFFADVALLRVLYAHALVAASRLALGRFAPIGRFLGDPRLRMADLFLSLRRTLPDRYPLNGYSVDAILERENRLGRVVDYAVIVPRVRALYRYSATELHEPRLLELCREGASIYAWPYEDRQVWTMARTPLSVRVLEGLTRLPAPAEAVASDRP